MYRASERVFDCDPERLRKDAGLGAGIQLITLLVTVATLALTIYLFVDRPQGLFPAAGHRPHDRLDPGRSGHFVPGDAETARAIRSTRQRRSGGRQRDRLYRRNGGAANTGRMFIALKPLDERKISADEVIARLRARTGAHSRRQLYLQAVQDLRIGGRTQRRAISIHAAGRRP